MRSRLRRWLPLMMMALTACTGGASTPASTVTPYPTLDVGKVSRGREIYQQNCATCHGANAGGAANWATPGPDGLYPPPPHDDIGHTWHHSDRVLYEIIRDGMGDPLRPDSPLRMPAWGSTLSDADIRAAIEYFKSLWTAEHRQWQWNETLKDFAPTPTVVPQASDEHQFDGTYIEGPAPRDLDRFVVQLVDAEGKVVAQTDEDPDSPAYGAPFALPAKADNLRIVVKTGKRINLGKRHFYKDKA